MAVFVVHFLEPVQIQNDQAERLAVAAGAVKLFFEGFAEKPAIVKAGERVGGGVQFQFFQVVIFGGYLGANEPGSSQNIHESSLERYRNANLSA